ncbi:VOC family protein [Paenibacillus sp. y28]|uniref:VOC family protein n=1 Tax=Paenibacillus sp. y28 TaxID=3129110 RepID=UPI00301A40A4
MIHKLEHIGIRVSDMDASIRFYTEVLGLQLACRKPLADGVELAFLCFPGSENIELELIGRGTEGLSSDGIVHHVAFTVSDIEAEVARLRELGVKLISEEPKVILDGVKIFFFYGPDGEQLELFQPKAE